MAPLNQGGITGPLVTVRMAMRDLLEGECGGPNAVVKLTSHLTGDRLENVEITHTLPDVTVFSYR